MKDKDKKILESVKTPAYVVDKGLLVKNLEVLKQVIDATGCKILLALKGFSMYEVFPLIGEYLNGTTSSSLFEAKLGRDFMDKEVHIYAPAYIDSEFQDVMNTCDHIVFNSVTQYNRFKSQVQESGKHIECGIRVNPEYSEVTTEIYDPCAIGSRLGTVARNIKEEDLIGIDGLHFHTMCEQNSDTLERTLEVVEKKFGKYFYNLKWVNFGGGHHVTRQDYDMAKLIRLINHIQDTYDVQVYLEPGEAIALNTGFLVTSVLDIIKNEVEVAIIDSSASCHMPDVIEMPYRPLVIDSGQAHELAYTYRLGGLTCLAGDIVGDYSFQRKLDIGDKLIFTDMAHYTMVKNNMFNGVNLPDIVLKEGDRLKVIRSFDYEDYKSRLS